MTQRLQSAGWPEATAAAVAEYHAGWLAALKAQDRNHFDRTVLRLEQLRTTGFADILARRPELVGLLRLVPDPVELAAVLDDPDDGALLASLFQLHAAEDDARGLAAALVVHARLIARLVKRGFVGAEYAFVFPRGTPAAAEYDRWLRDVFRDALPRDNDALAATIFFLLDQGPAIRERLAGDPAFLARWQTTWETFWRVVQRANEDRPHDDLAAYADLPKLWDFLALPSAEKLLVRHGSSAAVLWAKAAPDDQPEVVRLLGLEDGAVVDFLWEAQDEPKLLLFLRQTPPLPDAVWSQLAADLLPYKGAEFGRRLAGHQGRLAVSRAKLQDGLTPSDGAVTYIPGYDVYKVLDQWAAGEDPATLDLLFAAADVASLAIPGGKVVTTLGKAGAKRGGKAGAKELAAAAIKKQARAGGNKFSRAVAREKIPADLIGRAGYSAHAASFRAGPVEVTWSTLDVNVTPLVQMMFKRFRLGRETFRRLTGLEVRVFMRRDATVVLRYRTAEPAKAAAGLALSLYLQTLAPDDDAPGAERPEDPKRAAGTLWLASAAGLLPGE